jgi:tetratricopeptide (TPR) repeat protein
LTIPEVLGERSFEIMSAVSSTIEPLLSAGERDELGHLDYLLRQMKDLLERGLIASDSYATVVAESQRRREAIEQQGRYQAAMARTRTLARSRPGEALEWADQARQIDPSQLEAVVMTIDLSWEVEEDEQAIAIGTEAAERFPQLRHKLDRLLGLKAEREEARHRKAEQLQQDLEISERLEQARMAMNDHHDAEAVALCREVLDLRPRQVEAMTIAAFALQRMGQVDEALAIYETLQSMQPTVPAWSRWVKSLRTRLRVERLTGISPEPASGGHGTTSEAGVGMIEPPRFSWSAFAGEFLQEHWQKLILCLAVLLIVVSSTVAAHLLLGPLLWSPAGKCALALMGTLMFAALGAGLVRWGAERAGQMMLVATLIIVPIHFMLAGELKLLTEPSAFGLGLLAVDGLALVGLVRMVSGMLVPRDEARFLTIALLLLSTGSAATAPGAPVPWGWQFAAFQAPAVVFLGAVWALGARRWGASPEAYRQFATLVLGLLGFAGLACLIRIGVHVLHLEPASYAGPVMLAAIAVVHSVRRLAPVEPDARRLALIELGGYVLSGLAFALALSSPPIHSAFFSGNTVAVSLLGFALYAVSLRQKRQPVFLYLTIGALVAARVGAHYFLADRIRMVIDVIRVALRYQEALPWPFLALLGLVLNPVLALLSLWFSRAWKDERLARHCHYIGLPLAIAACLYSGFEPLAGAICLSGYTIWFALAVWLFAAPALSFLTIGSLAGAAYFGSTFIPGVTVADQALLSAALAWVCWIICKTLRRLDVDEVYALAWTMASRGLSTLALVVATLFIAAKGPNSIGAAGAFALVASLALVLNRERPWIVRAGVALVSFVELTICGLSLATGGVSLFAADYGLLLVGDALAFLAAAEVLRLALRTVATPAALSPIGIRPAPRAAEVFVSILPRFVIVLTFVADWLALLNLGISWVSGLVWLLGAPALLGTTRFVKRTGLVYLGLAQLVAGVLDLSYWPITWGQSGLAAGWLAVVTGLLALSMWLAGVLTRRRGWSDFYALPCLNMSLCLTAGGLGLAVGSRFLTVSACRFGVIALALTATVTMLLARTLRQAGLTYAAVFHVVTATYLVLFSVGNNDPRMAFVLGLTAVVEAIVFWMVAFGCETLGGDWVRSCARPLYHWTVVLAILGILLADRSAVTMAVAALAFLLTVKSLARAEWLYGVVAALGAACYLRWLATMPAIGVIGFVTASAFALWAVGVLIQRSKAALCARLALRPLDYEYPLFHASIAAGLIALMLRVPLSLDHVIAWTAHPWLPLGLSVLSILMLRAYPRREWVHAGLAFLAWSVVAVIAPSLTSGSSLAMAGMALTLGLSMLERVARPHEATVCARLGVVDAGYVPVVRNWALVLFGMAAVLAIGIVIGGMGAAMLGHEPFRMSSSTADWWILLATIGLASFFIVIEGADPEGSTASEPEYLLIGLHWIGVLALWWLGVASSPLAGQLPSPADYYPTVTAMAALAAILFWRRFTRGESWQELSWLGDIRSERSSRAMSYQACILAILAVAFTGGTVALTTVASLFLAALTLGFGGITIGSPLVAGMGSLAFAGAWSFAGQLVAHRLGYGGFAMEGTWGASGAIAAAFLLWWLAGMLRLERSSPKAKGVHGDSDSGRSLQCKLAEAMEGVASASALIAGAVVLAAGTCAATLGSWGTFAGVGVLLAAAVLHILLVPRWRTEWLVYLAHGLMVGAYIDYRLAFPMSTAADAAILTLLGYIDLALSEALSLIQGPEYYIRPTRYFSLMLPLLPLLQLLTTGVRDGVSLFYLSAAATFYAVACAQMRWKWLGYAAAVFCNAALWVTWSRQGWMLADHPQFYLVPVGLSTILFAEVNRELGRDAVNAIRSVGLIVVYASLAAPIWQFDSFGAWLTFLLVSLLGIFAGIGLRLQTFLWLGLTTFVLDVVYEMGRVSLDHAFAKWVIMLILGIGLVMFVALNEKKRIVSTMLDYYARARTWE